MPCQLHPTAGTTAKRVLLEVYSLDGQPSYRLADAELLLCAACGSRWYDDAQLARLPHAAVTPAPAPVQDN